MSTDADSSLAVVRRTLAALNRQSVPELLELADPEIRVETPLIEVWGIQLRGHDLVREWIQRIQGEFAFLELYDVELEEHGEWVLGRMRARGRGKASPRELDWELHLAIRVIDARVVRFGSYLSRERALAAIEDAAE